MFLRLPPLKAARYLLAWGNPCCATCYKHMTGVLKLLIYVIEQMVETFIPVR